MTEKYTPDYIFETSWEVCNLVGGIYTVLSTRALILEQQLHDNLIFIGPDIFKDTVNSYFTESDNLLGGLSEYTNIQYGLDIRIGRWNIPGNPIAILVDFNPLMQKRNEIFGHIWEQFGVDSLHAYGDYFESSMFGYAAGMVMESYYNFYKLSKKQKVVAHFNEWMTSFGLFYVKEHLPEVATVFTTHATSIGRSIAGNNKPLYDYLEQYNGDQMAWELNMVAKHSTEKIAAHTADCFTTVSDITARECQYLLEKPVDIVTPNGFEDSFVPKGKTFIKKRTEARKLLCSVAERLLGYSLQADALFVGTAGRYEYKNKGLDVFIEALNKLKEKQSSKEIIAFFIVPAGANAPRWDMTKAADDNPQWLEEWNHFTTHELWDYENDSIMKAIRSYQLTNKQESHVKIIFIPSYLNGYDGIFNKVYYDILIGLDLTVFPSYYEPWGYTPLESIAFCIPTITTDLSGFGQWVSPNPQGIESGVGIIHRSDYNSVEVAQSIAEMIEYFSSLPQNEIDIIRKKSAEIAQKALWQNFIHYYEEAYHIALSKK